MNGSLWLLPDDGPMGPWLRVEPFLGGLPAGKLPFVCFRNEPSDATQKLMDRLGVHFASLGRKGLNRLACAWRLGKILRSRDFHEMMVWDVSEVHYALVAKPKKMKISVELVQDQPKPAFLKWFPAVQTWYRRGLVQSAHPGEYSVPHLFPGDLEDAAVQIPAGETKAKILLFADDPQSVRDGLWGFDIFRHAWPGSTLEVVASAAVLQAGKNFAGVLGLGNSVRFRPDWPKRGDLGEGFWMVLLLGNGSWLVDASLRARALGYPVVSLKNGPNDYLRNNGIIDQVVKGGDRAGLASTLQSIFQDHLATSQKEGYPERAAILASFGFDRVMDAYNHLSGRT